MESFLHSEFNYEDLVTFRFSLFDVLRLNLCCNRVHFRSPIDERLIAANDSNIKVERCGSCKWGYTHREII